MSGYVLCTRYVNPKGRVIRHVYLNDDNAPWQTRQRALTARRNHLQDLRDIEGADFVDKALSAGTFEVAVVKIVTMSIDS